MYRSFTLSVSFSLLCLFSLSLSFLPVSPLSLSVSPLSLSVSPLSLSLSVSVCPSVCLSVSLSPVSPSFYLFLFFSFLSFSVSLPLSDPFVSSLSVLICLLFLCLPALPIFLDHLSLSMSMCVHIPSRHLRSSTDTRVFRIPSFRTKSCGQRSFSYQAPVNWNQLPVFSPAILPLSALLNLP